MNEKTPPVTEICLRPIAIVHSCFKEKFGIPRQPGLAPSARAQLEILPPYDRDEAFRGLEGFSHLWLSFIFHQTQRDAWRPTVRPPRLGGNARIGVFASRSTYRPNPLGLSVVRLLGITREQGRLLLELGGVDLLDQTPVVDIKPYLPYADIIDKAEAGYAPEYPPRLEVHFSEAAQSQLAHWQQRYPLLQELIIESLSQDPRPAYQREEGGREYGVRFYDVDVRWCLRQGTVWVTALVPIEDE